MAALLDRCRFNPAAGGTTDWGVATAITGFNTPSQAGAVNGLVYRFVAESADLSQWEIAEGAHNSGVFARTTVLYNSAGTGTLQGGAGAKVNFSAAPQVAVVALSADLLSLRKKNYIVNGAMMVSQQNGTAAGTTSGYYPVDQFQYLGSNDATISVGQIASVSPAGSPNRIRFSVTTADASIGASQYAMIRTVLEGFRVADLKFGSASAKTVTLQFGVKAPAGTYCARFQSGAGGRTYVAEFTIAAGEANTDVIKFLTVPGDVAGTWPTNNTAGLVIDWALAVGSTFQGAANTWSASNVLGTSNQFNLLGTNGNVFELFDVELDEGSAAPPFQVPSFADELQICQRYYCKSFPIGTNPAQGTNGSDFRDRYACFSWAASGIDTQRICYPARMRAAPTITAYSPNNTTTAPTSGNWQFYNPTGPAFVNASATITTNSTTDSGFNLSLTTPTVTVGQGFICYGFWVADARL